MLVVVPESFSADGTEKVGGAWLWLFYEIQVFFISAFLFRHSLKVLEILLVE